MPWRHPGDLCSLDLVLFLLPFSVFVVFFMSTVMLAIKKYFTRRRRNSADYVSGRKVDRGSVGRGPGREGGGCSGLCSVLILVLTFFFY